MTQNLPHNSRRRQELIARYDEADEIAMDAEGKVVKVVSKGSKHKAAQQSEAPAGVESNDNAERVKVRVIGHCSRK